MKSQNLFLYRFNSLCLMAAFILLCGCKTDTEKQPFAIKGEINLANSDLNHSSVLLNGEWLFYPGSFNTKGNSSPIIVPGEWSTQLDDKNPGYGTYLLRVKLPKNPPVLGLKIFGISTSYILEINGLVIDSSGIPSSGPGTVPAYERKIYPLQQQDSLLQIVLKVANFHHYKGGILQPLVLGQYDTMVSESKNYSLIGGIFIGICVINAIIYLVLFFFMRQAKYFLFYALFSIITVIHILCLIDRIMYSILDSPGASIGWIAAYKIELFTLYLGFTWTFLFYNSLFKGVFQNKILYFFCSLLILQALFVLIAPAPLFTYIDLLIPFNGLAVLVGMMFIFIRAYKKQMEGFTTVAVFNIFLLVVFAHENFILDNHVHEMQLIHFSIIVYVTGVSIVLLRKIINAFANEKTLSADLHTAKEKLERQNRNLEEIVERRTVQLIEAEKQSHELQMEKRERDLDTLAASNRMKLQFGRNLIEELEELPRAEKELKSALNVLITKLKGQISIEEKLDVLQQDMDRINAEFYGRLMERFPDLSKTERELCAYIKLSLSTKDIAELRKTSLNTINVARSRLRKKFALSRDEELESFIQQF